MAPHLHSEPSALRLKQLNSVQKVTWIQSFGSALAGGTFDSPSFYHLLYDNVNKSSFLQLHKF